MKEKEQIPYIHGMHTCHTIPYIACIHAITLPYIACINACHTIPYVACIHAITLPYIACINAIHNDIQGLPTYNEYHANNLET